MAHATDETLVDGQILLGSYLDTAPGGSYERLGERHQGGRPSQRIGKLEHVWTVSGVAPGAALALEVDAEGLPEEEDDTEPGEGDAPDGDPGGATGEPLAEQEGNRTPTDELLQRQQQLQREGGGDE